MRKICFLPLVLALLLSVSACGTAEEPDASGVVDTPDPAPVTSAPEITSRDVTFTESDKTRMEEYLGSCSYMIFMQMMDNGIEGDMRYSSTRYTISLNTTQDVQSISMKYITVNGVDREGVGYTMYSDGKTNIVSEDGVWKEAGPEYSTLAWDLSSFNSALDVYRYLLHDIQLPVGREGIDVGGYWTFEWVEPADDSLLVGLSYDELLDASYKFTFREQGDDLLPDSITIRVGYVVDETQYYVESTIQVNSVGNTKIQMPEVGEKS